MKKSMKAVSIILLCLATNVSADDKNAIMVEKVDDSIDIEESIKAAENFALGKPMSVDKGKVKTYRHCYQNISGSKSGFKRMGKEMADEAAEGGKYNDIKSVELINTCPLPANAACDHGSRIEYFYTNSKELLDGYRSGCEYLKNKWLTFKPTHDDKK